MNLNNKLTKYVSSITGINLEDTMRRRNIFATYHLTRVNFLESLVKQGLKGKDYSEAVIEYDKQFIKQPLY